MAFEKDWTVFSKYADWGGASGLIWVDVYGKDLSGATFSWAFGEASDLAADFTLDTQAAGTEGVSAEWFPNAVHPETGAVTGKTRITPQIDAATLQSLTFEGVEDLGLVATLYITVDGAKMPMGKANLTIEQGING